MAFIIFVFFAAVVGELFFPADIPEWLRQVQTFGASLPWPIGNHWAAFLYYGPLRRSGRARKEDVHPEHSADGIADVGAIGLLPTLRVGCSIAAPLLLLLMRILQAAIGGRARRSALVAEHAGKALHWYRLRTSHCGPDGWHSTGIGGRGLLINTVPTPQGFYRTAAGVFFLLGMYLVWRPAYLRRWLATPIFSRNAAA